MGDRTSADATIRFPAGNPFAAEAALGNIPTGLEKLLDDIEEDVLPEILAVIAAGGTLEIEEDEANYGNIAGVTDEELLAMLGPIEFDYGWGPGDEYAAGRSFSRKGELRTHLKAGDTFVATVGDLRRYHAQGLSAAQVADLLEQPTIPWTYDVPSNIASLQR